VLPRARGRVCSTCLLRGGPRTCMPGNGSAVVHYDVCRPSCSPSPRHRQLLNARFSIYQHVAIATADINPRSHLDPSSLSYTASLYSSAGGKLHRAFNPVNCSTTTSYCVAQTHHLVCRGWDTNKTRARTEGLGPGRFSVEKLWVEQVAGTSS
jgi:hypothetical protein